MASISHRISIAWPPEPPTEPTSTLVLTTPNHRFVDIRASPPLQTRDLYWGIGGVSIYDPATRTGTWKHSIDSRSDDPQDDSGVMSDLENGDVLEKGVMVDFEDGRLKPYEEVWRDDVLEVGSVVLAVEGSGEGVKGLAVRLGDWCQAIVKVKGEVSTGRWRLKGGNEPWGLEFSSGPLGWGDDWPAQLSGEGKGEVSGIEWAVVESSVQ